MNPRIANAVAIVITVAWAVSFVADIFLDGYSMPPAVHALMMGLAGSIFGQSFIRGARTYYTGGAPDRRDPEPDEPEPPPAAPPRPAKRRPPAKRPPVRRTDD